MKHVCAVIDQVGSVIDPTMRVTAWGIDVARVHFGENKEQFALFILSLIDVYAKRTDKFSKPSNFDVAYAFEHGKKVCDDIAIFGKGNKLLLASCNYEYGKAARDAGLKELAAEFLETALRQPSMQPLPELILKELEAIYLEEAPAKGWCPKLVSVLEQLLDVDQLNPEVFDAQVQLPLIHNHPFFKTVSIERDIDVAVAARLAEVKLEDFKALNPQMNRPVILAAGTPQILLPWDNATVFQRNLEGYTSGRYASWTAWTAPATMSVTEAARRVGMNEAEFRAINSIPPRMLIRAGSTVLAEPLSRAARSKVLPCSARR